MPRIASDRVSWRRVCERTLLGVAILALGVELCSTVLYRITEIPYGADLRIYLDATARFLGGGSYYRPEQLAGPYTPDVGDILYPPTSIALFAPFLVLPLVVWWAIPVSIVLVTVATHRPSILGWAGILLALACPNSLPLLITGNPVLWVSAGVAGATVFGWPAVVALLKPSLAPFALLGIGLRSWWIAVAAFLVASVAFAPIWDDYFVVLANARRDLLPLYSLGDVPLVTIPLISWATRAGKMRRPKAIAVRATA